MGHQEDRARQVLERSADLAGFFESGKTKLVMLGQGSGGIVRDPPREKGGARS